MTKTPLPISVTASDEERLQKLIAILESGKGYIEKVKPGDVGERKTFVDQSIKTVNESTIETGEWVDDGTDGRIFQGVDRKDLIPSEKELDEILVMLKAMAAANNIDYHFLVDLVYEESRFDPNAGYGYYSDEVGDNTENTTKQKYACKFPNYNLVSGGVQANYAHNVKTAAECADAVDPKRGGNDTIGDGEWKKVSAAGLFQMTKELVGDIRGKENIFKTVPTIIDDYENFDAFHAGDSIKVAKLIFLSDTKLEWKYNKWPNTIDKMVATPHWERTEINRILMGGTTEQVLPPVPGLPVNAEAAEASFEHIEKDLSEHKGEDVARGIINRNWGVINREGDVAEGTITMWFKLKDGSLISITDVSTWAFPHLTGVES